MAEQYIEDLNFLRSSGAFDRIERITRRDYTSGDETTVQTVRIRRSSGQWSRAVVVSGGHAGLSTYVKLRDEKGGKLVATMDMVEWNPWLRGKSKA